jgi:hypothetical protein
VPRHRIEEIEAGPSEEEDLVAGASAPPVAVDVPAWVVAVGDVAADVAAGVDVVASIERKQFRISCKRHLQ